MLFEYLGNNDIISASAMVEKAIFNKEYPEKANVLKGINQLIKLQKQASMSIISKQLIAYKLYYIYTNGYVVYIFSELPKELSDLEIVSNDNLAELCLNAIDAALTSPFDYDKLNMDPKLLKSINLIDPATFRELVPFNLDSRKQGLVSHNCLVLGRVGAK